MFTPELLPPFVKIQSENEATGIIVGAIDKEAKNLLVVDTDNPEMNKNLLVFGGSSTGKTHCYIKQYCVQAIKRGESVILADPKGELYEDMSAYFVKNGYTVRRFDISMPRNSDHWDVFSYVNTLDEYRQREIRNIIGGFPELTTPFGVLGHNEIDMNLPTQEKCAYFVRSSAEYTSMREESNFIGALFIEALLSKIYENEYCKIPVNFVLDDFSLMGPIPKFAKIVKQGSLKNVSFCIATNALYQLKKRYPESWKAITDACSTWVYTHINEMETFEYFVDYMADNQVLDVKSGVKFKAIGISFPLTQSADETLIVSPGECGIAAYKAAISQRSFAEELKPSNAANYIPARMY